MTGPHSVIPHRMEPVGFCLRIDQVLLFNSWGAQFVCTRNECVHSSFIQTDELARRLPLESGSPGPGRLFRV